MAPFLKLHRGAGLSLRVTAPGVCPHCGPQSCVFSASVTLRAVFSRWCCGHESRGTCTQPFQGPVPAPRQPNASMASLDECLGSHLHPASLEAPLVLFALCRRGAPTQSPGSPDTLGPLPCTPAPLHWTVICLAESVCLWGCNLSGCQLLARAIPTGAG